ncbi:MAG: hypothetical protein LBI39_02055, partial [Puniceicoccales bacterium]|nr:hypothetical protein [Puniceicoccales bacterium]
AEKAKQKLSGVPPPIQDESQDDDWAAMRNVADIFADVKNCGDAKGLHAYANSLDAIATGTHGSAEDAAGKLTESVAKLFETTTDKIGFRIRQGVQLQDIILLANLQRLLALSTLGEVKRKEFKATKELARRDAIYDAIMPRLDYSDNCSCMSGLLEVGVEHGAEGDEAISLSDAEKVLSEALDENDGEVRNFLGITGVAKNFIQWYFQSVSTYLKSGGVASELQCDGNICCEIGDDMNLLGIFEMMRFNADQTGKSDADLESQLVGGTAFADKATFLDNLYKFLCIFAAIGDAVIPLLSGYFGEVSKIEHENDRKAIVGAVKAYDPLARAVADEATAISNLAVAKNDVMLRLTACKANSG